MGAFFSDAVEQALSDLYYQMGNGRGRDAFRLLEKAAGAGDGDASCLLARCLSGAQYMWDGHGFPEDETEAERLLLQGVRQKSALAILFCLRTGGLSSILKQALTTADLQAAFDAIWKKAAAGEPFCQYTIGNVFFWQDFLLIQKTDRADFPSQNAFRDFVRENAARCENWFWKAFQNGVFLGGSNLEHYYQNGIRGLIAPQPEKASAINRLGAGYGYPNYQYLYARDLLKSGKEEAFSWFRRAADHGEKRACFGAGYSCELGKGVKKDAARAARYYRQGLETRENRENCCNRLGALCFYGNGVPRDYEQAYRLLKWADDQKTTGNWGVYFLGACRALGLGVPKDYAAARAYLERVTWHSPNAFYLLGLLYVRGLGGPEDLEAGIRLLQKAGDLPEAREELSHYRKNRFGGWNRR